jgi:AraC-like DNA-binding protein
MATIGYDWPQEAIKRPDGFPDYQWLHSLAGRGTLTIGDKTWEIGPGEGIFLQPNEAHEYRPLDGDWTTDWISFGGFAITRMLDFAGLTSSGPYELSDLWRLKAIMREVYASAHDDSVIAYQDSSLLVYELLLTLRTALDRPTRNSEPRHAKLRPVLQHIRAHYMDDLSINDLADTIQVTPQYLCQLFKQSLDMRPFEYLTAFRISRAKELLCMQQDLPISDVAKAVGFSDSNYLCRIFKKSDGISPGAFRKLHTNYREE